MNNVYTLLRAAARRGAAAGAQDILNEKTRLLKPVATPHPYEDRTTNWPAAPQPRLLSKQTDKFIGIDLQDTDLALVAVSRYG